MSNLLGAEVPAPSTPRPGTPNRTNRRGGESTRKETSNFDSARMIVFQGLSNSSGARLLLFLASMALCSVSLLYFEYWGNLQLKAFGDALQTAVREQPEVRVPELYASVFSLISYKLATVLLRSASSFLSKKSAFFWRLQLTEHFLRNWDCVYSTEGAAQRTQDDTMRYCRLFEKLLIFAVHDLFKLAIYLPLLLDLSSHITKTWLIPSTRHVLLLLVVANSAIGTSVLIFPSKILSRHIYRIDREEALFRKNLVLLELEEKNPSELNLDQVYKDLDSAHRGFYRRSLLVKAFQLVYFRMSVISYWLFAHPSMQPPYTLGLLKQTMHAFDEVSSVFNFALSHFSSLVEIIAVYSRLSSMIKQTVKTN